MAWTKVEAMMYLCAKYLRSWSLLNKTEDKVVLEAWAKELEVRGGKTSPAGMASSSLSNRLCGGKDRLHG
jgi:hypothetical protein